MSFNQEGLFLGLVLWYEDKIVDKCCISALGRVFSTIRHSSTGSEGSLCKILFIGNGGEPMIVVRKNMKISLG